MVVVRFTDAWKPEISNGVSGLVRASSTLLSPDAVLALPSSILHMLLTVFQDF
jgi:hypothetical protein